MLCCFVLAVLSSLVFYALMRSKLTLKVMLSCSVLSDSFQPPWTVAHQALLSIGLSRQED